jgi:hypothetical protein
MFSVHLPPDAMADLDAVWSAGRSEECDAVIGGLRDLRSRLEVDPADQGESRGRCQRIIIGDGVAATFEIYHERRVVRILRAWAFRRRR